MGSYKNLYAKIKTKTILNITKSSFKIVEASVWKIVIKHHSLLENLKSLNAKTLLDNHKLSLKFGLSKLLLKFVKRLL